MREVAWERGGRRGRGPILPGLGALALALATRLPLHRREDLSVPQRRKSG